MKKIFVLLSLAFILTGCINSKETIITINDVALNNNAIIGALNSIYRMNTEYKNDDNSYIVFNFQSITYNEKYSTSSKEEIKNVIIIENGVTKIENVNLIAKVAYIQAFDTFGKEIQLGDIYTDVGNEFSEIIFSAKDILKTSQIKYILIGGLDISTNDKPKAIFEL